MLHRTAGVPFRRYDYQPFGQEVLAGTNGRTTATGYFSAADGTEPKFTGQYRDAETSLDWFNVRHMSGSQGRFQSIDPANAGANMADPRTWNGYAYVNNDPLSYTDPSGKGLFGDIGLVAGAFIPGVGPLVGWLFGTVADIGTGRSVSPFNLGGPPSPSSTLGGCGGPLGNCGTLGAGPWSEISGLGDVQDPERFILNAQRTTYPLGGGWTAARDVFEGGEGFELHVRNPSGKEVGILSGRRGWIGKHGLPDNARPTEIPDNVMNVLNGLNIKELRARGTLPETFRGFRYFNEGRIFMNAFPLLTMILDELAADISMHRNSVENNRGDVQEACAEARGSGYPSGYVITTMGPVYSPLLCAGASGRMF